MSDQNTIHHWRRQFAVYSRWLHIYLSMVSFAIVLFFAVTGLTLNHTDWFASQQRTVQLRGQVRPEWVRTPSDDQVAKLEIVEHLRNSHQIKAAMTDLRIDETQCAVSFKGPGYTADAFIDRQTGDYDLTENRMGFVAILNDLHKGRDTGRGWLWLIDGAAIFMTLVSVTGIFLILFLKRWRTSGLVCVLVGALLSLAIYWRWGG